MENKYYTPEKEDIKIGDSIEIYEQATGKMIRDVKWHSVKVVVGNSEYGESISINQIPKLLKQDKVRVKLIDKKDIESFGWSQENILIEDDDGNDLFCSGFSKSIDENHWYELVLQDNYKILVQYKWYRNSVAQLCRTVYYGTCKSKNELITIQKLLGI